MVGEEQHAPAVGGHLDRAAHHPLAAQLTLARPLQRRALQPQADPVAVGRDRVRLTAQRDPRLVGEPVPARPVMQAHANLTGLRLGHRREVDAVHRVLVLAHRQLVTGLQGGRTEAGEHVGRARAQHGGDVDAPAQPEVGPHARDREPKLELLAGAQHERRQVGHARAVRAGRGQGEQSAGPQRESAHGHLEHGGVGAARDQPVGYRSRPAIRGPRAADAQRGGPDVDGGHRGPPDRQRCRSLRSRPPASGCRVRSGWRRRDRARRPAPRLRPGARASATWPATRQTWVPRFAPECGCGALPREKAALATPELQQTGVEPRRLLGRSSGRARLIDCTHEGGRDDPARRDPRR